MGHCRQAKRNIKYRMWNTRYYNTQEKEITPNVDSIVYFNNLRIFERTIN